MTYQSSAFTRHSYLWVTVAILGGELLGAGMLWGALAFGLTTTTAPATTLFAFIGFLMTYLYRMLYLVPQFDARLSMGETRKALYRAFTVDSILFTLYGFALCALVVWLDPKICHLIAPHANTTELIISQIAVEFLCYAFPLVLGLRLFYLAAILRYRKTAQYAFAILYFVGIFLFPSWGNIAPNSLLGRAVTLLSAPLAQVSPVLLGWVFGLVLWGLGARLVGKVAVKM